MVTKEELKKLIGKKCWIYQGTLEILSPTEPADSEIIDVKEKGFADVDLVITNRGRIYTIPIYEIKKIVRKDF
jgi:hypothetical protein